MINGGIALPTATHMTSERQIVPAAEAFRGFKPKSPRCRSRYIIIGVLGTTAQGVQTRKPRTHCHVEDPIVPRRKNTHVYEIRDSELTLRETLDIIVLQRVLFFFFLYL